MHSNGRLRPIACTRRLAHGATGVGAAGCLAHGVPDNGGSGIVLPRGRWIRDEWWQGARRAHGAPDIGAPGISAPQCRRRGDKRWKGLRRRNGCSGCGHAGIW